MKVCVFSEAETGKIWCERLEILRLRKNLKLCLLEPQNQLSYVFSLSPGETCVPQDHRGWNASLNTEPRALNWAPALAGLHLSGRRDYSSMVFLHTEPVLHGTMSVTLVYLQPIKKLPYFLECINEWTKVTVQEKWVLLRAVSMMSILSREE